VVHNNPGVGGRVAVAMVVIYSFCILLGRLVVVVMVVVVMMVVVRVSPAAPGWHAGRTDHRSGGRSLHCTPRVQASTQALCGVP